MIQAFKMVRNNHLADIILLQSFWSNMPEGLLCVIGYAYFHVICS
jgi:hypothetical protein